ncbi:MAG: helical backbone metal receptor, partial [Achromobacter kerstersii]|uniref:helical backbone metal receptor n=1 Tax=Achromobacter kerstersii TaxID=1353890 RepID=UPI003CFE796E
MTDSRAFPRIAPGLLIALGAVLAGPVLAASAVDSNRAPLEVQPSQSQNPNIQVRDDQGHTVLLAAPARRAVTLAPHATELVYAAGAGRFLIATIRGSDYPAAARQLPVIGNGMQPDAERVAGVRPDLLIAWQPTAAEPLVRVMDKLGVPVFYSDPLTLAAIPDAVERMGVLFGTEEHARPAAQSLRDRLAALSARYTGRRPVRVFVQAGLDPIYTLNNSSIVSDALRLCGGINVFGLAPVVAPQVTLENVLAARPEAVLAGVSRPEDTAKNLAAWQALGLPA